MSTSTTRTFAISRKKTRRPKTATPSASSRRSLGADRFAVVSVFARCIRILRDTSNGVTLREEQRNRNGHQSTAADRRDTRPRQRSHYPYQRRDPALQPPSHHARGGHGGAAQAQEFQSAAHRHGRPGRAAGTLP